MFHMLAIAQRTVVASSLGISSGAARRTKSTDQFTLRQKWSRSRPSAIFHKALGHESTKRADSLVLLVVARSERLGLLTVAGTRIFV